MNTRNVSMMIVLLVLTGFIKAQEPVFRLENLDGEWKEYEDLKGQELTIIDFWATWCQPCVRALPVLSDMAEEFREKGVEFIGVSVDGPRNQNKITPFVRSLNIGYPILRDIDNELMSELSVSAVPTLLIYNKEGEQLYFHEGFRPGDEAIIRNHIIEYLKN